MKIQIFFSIMIFGEKNFDHKLFTIFSTKQLKMWLIHLHGYITYEGYEICVIEQGYYTNCTRKMC